MLLSFCQANYIVILEYQPYTSLILELDYHLLNPCLGPLYDRKRHGPGQDVHTGQNILEGMTVCARVILYAPHNEKKRY